MKGSVSQNFVGLYVDSNNLFSKIAGKRFHYKSCNEGESGRSPVTVNQKSNARFQKTFLLSAFFCLCYILRLYVSLARSVKLYEACGLFAIFSIILAITLKSWELWRIPDVAAESLNGLLTIDAMLPETFTRSWGDLLKVKVAILFIEYNQKFLAFALSPTAGLACCIQPELPLNMLPAFVAPHNFGMQVFWRLTILFTNTVIWTFWAVAGNVIVVDLIVTSSCLSCCMNSVSEWTLQILTQKQRKDDTLRHQLTTIRAVTVATHIYNQAVSLTLFGALFTGVTFQVVGLWILVASQIEIPLTSQIVFAAGVLDGFMLILVGYDISADLNLISLQTLGKLGHHKYIMRCKYLKKYIRSCRPIRIMLGSSNFVEKSTPIAFQKFCLEKIIDLLLIGRRKALQN